MKTIILILCLGLIFTGCKKLSNSAPQSQEDKSQAVITGYYLAPCPYVECGGLMVTIKNDTAKNPPPFYLIYSTPSELGITDSTKFPINVRLNWKHVLQHLGAPMISLYLK